MTSHQMWPSKQKASLHLVVFWKYCSEIFSYKNPILAVKYLIIYWFLLQLTFFITDGWILPSFSNISIAYRGGGWDGQPEWGGMGRVGGVEGGKNLHSGHLMSSHDALQWPMPQQWATESVGTNSGPHCPISILYWCHCSSCDLGGLTKCPLEKQTS